MKRTELIALANSMDADAKAHREAYAEDMSGSPITAKLLEDGSAILRQIAESKPVGTVAQHSYETFQSVSYGDGKVTPWTLKRPHAAPMLFRELEVGTALYTLPLED